MSPRHRRVRVVQWTWLTGLAANMRYLREALDGQVTRRAEGKIVGMPSATLDTCKDTRTLTGLVEYIN